MRPFDSLSFRLLGALALTQTVFVVAGMVGWMLFSPFVNFTDVAANTTKDLVTQSLVVTPSGPEIRPSPNLVSYAQRRSALAYAALSNGSIVRGSSPELARSLQLLGPMLPSEGQLAMSSGAETTRFFTAKWDGVSVVIATRGNRFGPDDLGTYFFSFLVQLLPIIGPALLGAAVLLPILLRRALKPILRASQEAESIDLRSLDRRLEVRGVPSEVSPLVRATNALLDRIQADVGRQRLFTANAAHELRTPAAVLEAQIDALPRSPEKLDLKEAVQRLTLLINQMLAVARIGRSETAVEEDIELVGCLRAVVANLAPLAFRRGRRLAFEAEVASLSLRGNAQGLASAVANLIDNALHVEPHGGAVILWLRLGEEHAIISVVDHGPGLEIADRELAFEPFWRKSETRVGAGLGLSTVKEIATLHGGLVRILDTPGGGATFELHLPVLAAAVPHPRGSGQPAAMLA